MRHEWANHLLGGIYSAIGVRSQKLLADAEVECVFYGDVFRKPASMLGPGLVTDPFEVDLLMSWWRAAAAHGSVVSPDERTLAGSDIIRRALIALAGSSFVGKRADSALIFGLGQVRSYFTMPDLRDKILSRFADAIQPDTQVIVAHSLGSVIAYESLFAHPEWSIPALVTLGSPLAVPNLILNRLQPSPDAGPPIRGKRPPQIREWTNIAATNDFVALRKKLGDHFHGKITDWEIDNGGSFHSALRYLNAEVTGRAVASALGYVVS